MRHIKTLCLVGVVIFAITTGLCYFAFSFVLADFNAMKWPIEARGVFVFVIVFANIFSVGLSVLKLSFILDKEKDTK